MKNEFPLLDSLVMTGELPPVPPMVKLIEAQEATDKYWLDENDVWDLKKDFGCMTPPYPFMWVESTALMPKSQPANGKIVSPEVQPARLGFKVDAFKRDHFLEVAATMGRKFEDLKPCEWVYKFEMFSDLPRWPAITDHRNLPVRGYMAVDETGAMVQCWTEAKEKNPEKAKYLHEVVWTCGKAAFYAISMMNCKNVEVAARQTVERGGRKSRRKRSPSVEYHTIKLPAPKTSGSGSGTPTGTTKLHTARGHFKTYTADAPLMGRHVGTYYWGWQVRGNRKNGEIVSSYQVA